MLQRRKTTAVSDCFAVTPSRLNKLNLDSKRKSNRAGNPTRIEATIPIRSKNGGL
jgi:hypothetical protein